METSNIDWGQLDSSLSDMNILQLNFTKNLTFTNEKINEENKTNVLLYSPVLTIIISIVASTMSAITICGNILVITAFVIDKNLRKYSNYFILNLSIADLLIGLLIPPYAPFLLYNRVWKLGKFACTIWLVLDYVVGSASVLCIVVISLDRYLLVSKGLSYLNEQKISKAIWIMVTVWMIAFINYAPAIIFWELFAGVTTTKKDECQVAFHNSLVYLTATACVEFFLPFFLICGLNLAVYLNIRQRSRGLLQNGKLTKKINIAKNFRKLSTRDKKKVELNKQLIRNIDEQKDNQNENNASSEILAQPVIVLKKLSEGIIIQPNNKTKSDINNNKPKPNASMSSRAFLSKDKKAARSLFILVFVFVFCWVYFKLILYI
jgi:hypothetical protein